MKRIAILLFALGSTQALAGSLFNKDSTSYKYKLKCSGGTTSTSINSKTTASGGAKNGCEIQLDNGSTFKVDGDFDVLIEKGQLKKK